MNRLLRASGALVLALVLAATAATAAPLADYRIVTGGTTGTYYAFGQNLATIVAPPASIALEAVSSSGSVQNVRDMRYREKVKFALVQSDVYQAYVRLAAQGDKEAQELIGPLRVVLPLYLEEIHVLVAADSPLHYLDELRGKKLYVGPEGSGSALTAATLYGLMFDGERPVRVEFPGATDAATGYRQALNALLDRDGKVDAVVFVAGQPVAQLVVDAELGRKHYRLLAARADRPEMKTANGVYYPAEISRQSYAWLADDVPTLAVKAYLITYDYPQDFNRRAIAAFAQSLCANYDRLRAQGHPKWKQVAWSPAQPALETLKAGWQYYSVTEPILAGCRSGGTAAKGGGCTEERRMLGLCQ